MPHGNAIYPLYKQNLLAGTSGYDLDHNTVDDGVYCALINTDVYSYSPAHQFYTDLTGIVDSSDQRIVNPTVIGGLFDGDDVSFAAVTGLLVGALVLYRHNSGPASGWPLVMYYDQPGGNLPMVPNGGNILVQWNAEGIFLL